MYYTRVYVQSRRLRVLLFTISNLSKLEWAGSIRTGLEASRQEPVLHVATHAATTRKSDVKTVRTKHTSTCLMQRICEWLCKEIQFAVLVLKDLLCVIVRGPCCRVRETV